MSPAFSAVGCAGVITASRCQFYCLSITVIVVASGPRSPPFGPPARDRDRRRHLHGVTTVTPQEIRRALAPAERGAALAEYEATALPAARREHLDAARRGPPRVRQARRRGGK